MIAPQVFLGPPGCGKTTKILSIVEAEMGSGVRAEEIAFVTFTKRGVLEGQTRAAEKFHLNPRGELPWFRTVHSLAYAMMGIGREEVMSAHDWREFSLFSGYPLMPDKKIQSTDGESMVSIFPSAEQTEGDQMLRIIDFGITTGRSLENSWRFLNSEIDWHMLKLFADSFSYYKRESGKLDFTDMLANYASQGDPLPVRVAVIDEAQDLTYLQWQVVRRAFANCERVYIAGDDDQSIFAWSGADVNQFLALTGNHVVLDQSHRLPRQIQTFAQKITAKIHRRFDKPFRPREAEGELHWHSELNEVDFSSGKWLVLARNSYHLDGVRETLRERGFLYTTRSQPSILRNHVESMFLWENLRSGRAQDMSSKEARHLAQALGRPVPAMKEKERIPLSALGIVMPREQLPLWHLALQGLPLETREYYISCLRSKEKLRDLPRIRLDTIHGVKGAEEDNVVILTDVSGKTYDGMQADPDAEHRVFYVGVTRARETLHIIEPVTDRYYEMPHIDK